MTIKLPIDIETIPDQRPGAFERYLDAVEPPANYKKQETIDNWMLENAERVALESFQKTALNGLHGEICSISWALDDSDIQVLTRGADDMSEKELLDKFWDSLEFALNEMGGKSGRWPKLEWVGHNVLEFDLRFLKQRCLVNRVRPAYEIPADGRHGQGWVFDTMKEWSGWRGYVKQDDLCEAFGIAAPDWAQHVCAVDGSQVWELWRNGEYDLIALYNKLDVWKVYEIYKRMRGL